MEPLSLIFTSMIDGTGRTDTENYLLYGLVLSCLLHLVFLFGLKKPIDVPTPSQSISVRLVSPPEKKRQMVTQPEKSLETAIPKDAAFESEKNAIAQKEQIKRGLIDAGAVVGKKQQESPVQMHRKPTPPQKSSKAKPKEQQGTKGLKLALDKESLLKKFAVQAPEEQPNFQKNREANVLSNYSAFSRPTGSGARFLGERGSSDYLPHLPDGDITLLNTKANRFAVFVRRVATQVFSQLRSSGWASLNASDVKAIQDFSVVRAVLSKEGELLSVRLEKPSGSRSFDLVLKQAVNAGAGDPHPPAEAAAVDGNIHFIFKAKSWTRMAASGRRGVVSEKRWLLLATGLE